MKNHFNFVFNYSTASTIFRFAFCLDRLQPTIVKSQKKSGKCKKRCFCGNSMANHYDFLVIFIFNPVENDWKRHCFVSSVTSFMRHKQKLNKTFSFNPFVFYFSPFRNICFFCFLSQKNFPRLLPSSYENSNPFSFINFPIRLNVKRIAV